MSLWLTRSVDRSSHRSCMASYTKTLLAIIETQKSQSFSVFVLGSDRCGTGMFCPADELDAATVVEGTRETFRPNICLLWLADYHEAIICWIASESLCITRNPCWLSVGAKGEGQSSRAAVSAPYW